MNSSEYQTTKIISQIIAGVGWIVIIICIIAALVALGSNSSQYSGGFNLISIIPFLGGIISGFILVILGQLTSAQIDNTNYNKQTGLLMEQILKILENKENSTFKKISKSESHTSQPNSSSVKTLNLTDIPNGFKIISMNINMIEKFIKPLGYKFIVGQNKWTIVHTNGIKEYAYSEEDIKHKIELIAKKELTILKWDSKSDI